MAFYRVLSIDGGGIRGIIPATILAGLEEICQAPIPSVFDLLIGTSTGGILALGLTAPDQTGRRPRNPAHSLLELYGTQAQAVFPGGGPPTTEQKIWGPGGSSGFLQHPIQALMGAAQRAGAPFGGNPKFAGSARYFVTGLAQALNRQIGDVSLSNALTRVLITSYDVAYSEPVLFSSFNWPPGAIVNVPMEVAARATSAGPTFFEPQLVRVGSQQRVLVDGGVFANNPSMIGFALGSILAAQAGRPLYLLSLGTGRRNPALPLTPDQVKTQNWLGTARNAFEAAMTGSGAMAEMILPTLMNLPGQRPRYVRIQTTVETCNFAMDDSSPQNTQCLGKLALGVLEKHAPELRAIAGALMAP
jgi:uncharacterized protein